ncbi:MAG: glycosyl transferase family 28 [Chitinophagaceae bacterium]|nr:glycosyl transferase family 28 [Chitinophagaceae bacterium]
MPKTEKNSDNKEKPLLLVCPLDWGLGHTTRMIPVIRHLLDLDCEVVVACNSTQRTLLEKEFAVLRFVHLKGYNIEYGQNKTGTMVKLLLLLPNILIKVKSEEVWFLRFLEQNRVNAVISDNRYGFGKTGITSILVTHQLQIRSGFGSLADAILRKLLYRRINSFTECWVPDFETQPNLAGKLSHPYKFPRIPVRYLGALSRLKACSDPGPELPNILIILSGPEPQRTILENIILNELGSRRFHDIVLIRGLPGGSNILPEIPGVLILNHANAEELNEFMCTSGLIISRSGYTTVMDVIKLKKKMVTVPTPGQSEQEYLARHLSENNIAACLLQKEFSLQSAILKSAAFPYHFPSVNMDQYKEVIASFIASQFSL